MRFVVFLLGIPAVCITCMVGYFFFEGSFTINVRAYCPEPLDEFVLPLTAMPADTAPGDLGIFLLLAGAYGLIGVLLAFWRCGWQGAFLMIVPLLTTSVLNPSVLVFTGLQLFVGLLAFFVFRLPIESDDDDEPKAKPKVRRNDADLEDEWAGRGKSKPKRTREDDDDEKEPRGKAKSKAKSKRKDDEDDE